MGCTQTNRRTSATLTKAWPFTSPTSTGRGEVGSSAMHSAVRGSCACASVCGCRCVSVFVCCACVRAPINTPQTHRPLYKRTMDTPRADAKSLAVPKGRTARPTPRGAPVFNSAHAASLTVPSPPAGGGGGRGVGCGAGRRAGRRADSRGAANARRGRGLNRRPARPHARRAPPATMVSARGPPKLCSATASSTNAAASPASKVQRTAICANRACGRRALV